MTQTQKFKQTEIGKIPTEWEVKSIRDFVEIKHGFAFRGEFFTEIPNKNILLTPGNFKIGGGFKSDKFKYTNEELPVNYILHEGDVIVTMTDLSKKGDTLGYSAKVPKIDDLKFLHNQRIGLLIFKNNKIDKDFIYWILRDKKYNHFVVGSSTGSTVKHTSPDRIKDYEFPLPPLPEQFSIAQILSSLDAKIELNNKMNKTLEAIGQALFKKWFVDERKGGWKEGFIGDNVLTELIKPSIDKFEGEKIYLPTANISNSSITSYDYKITFNERPSRASMQPKAGTIWFAKMKDSPKIQLFLEGENWKLNNLILSTGFAGIKPKQEALFYIWNIINNPSFEIEKDNLSMGTTMQAINNENISKIKYLIPDKETLLKFNQMVKSFYYRISLNNQEIQTLSSLRDTLLPKLMSGEVRVK
jgi:type I restriction enzyme S subunit